MTTEHSIEVFLVDPGQAEFGDEPEITIGPVLTVQFEPPVSPGDVSGPASSTNNAPAQFDGTTGKVIKNPNAAFDFVSQDITNVGSVDGRDVSADGAVLDAHVANFSNPHNVTAAQAGADPAGSATAAVAAHEVTYDHNNIPTSGEKDALQGTAGLPSDSNRYVTNGDSRLTDARTPLAHGSTHEDGGSDEIDVTNLSGLLADPQTPLGHASTHQPGGSDPLPTAAPVTGVGAGNLEGGSATFARSDHNHAIRESGGQDLTLGAVADGQLLGRNGTVLEGVTPAGSTDELVGVSANDTTPGYLLQKLVDGTGLTATELNDGGNEQLQLDVDYGDAAGTAVEGTNPRVPTQDENDALQGTDGAPSNANRYVTDSDARNSDSRSPTAHAASHQDGGTDEINVGGLSGLLADAQTPLAHAASHLPSGGDPLTTAAPTQGIGAGNTEGTAESFARSDHDHTIRESGGQDLTTGAIADLQFIRRNGTTLEGATPPDELAAVSANDTTPGYLLDKTSAGAGINLNELNDGADEDLEIEVDFGDGASQAVEGTNTRVPTQDENDALQGTDGSPSNANRYVTDSDPRNSDARTPTAHAASHENGGGDEISVAGLSGLLADAQTPLAHAASHLPSGGDPLTTAAPAQGIGAGNAEGTAESFARSDHNHEIRESGGQDLTMGAVADGQNLRRSGTSIIGVTPTDSDELVKVSANDTTAGYLLDKVAAGTGVQLNELNDGGDEDLEIEVLYGSTASTAVEGNDSRVPSQDENDALAGTNGAPSAANPYVTDSDPRNTDARTPTSHAASHQNGGADEINVGGLSGLLADDQNPLPHASTHENGGADEINVAGLSGVLADPQPPAGHAVSHQNGGSDEINVAGLSGLLGDPQTPLGHAASHLPSGSDPLTTAAPVNVDKSAAAEGTAESFSRSDHKHDIDTAAAVELTDSTNAEGSSTSLARADHTHAHGDRGGGSLHADVVSGGASGFMTGADKEKLDDFGTPIQASSATPVVVTSATPVLLDSMQILAPGAGNYLVWFSTTAFGTANGTDWDFELYVGGVAVPHTFREGEGQRTYGYAINAYITGVGGADDIEIFVTQPGGGNVTVNERTLTIMQVP